MFVFQKRTRSYKNIRVLRTWDLFSSESLVHNYIIQTIPVFFACLFYLHLQRDYVVF